MASIDIARIISDASQSRWTSPSQSRSMNSPTIPKDTEDFLEALVSSGVPYLLVGGIALLQYVEARNTQDIDFILSLADAKTIDGLEIKDSNDFFAQAFWGDLQIDLRRPKNPFFKEIFETESQAKDFAGHTLNTVTLRGLVLLKLYALPSLYRQGNISRATLYEGDITLLLNKEPLEKAELLQILKPHLIESDLNEVSKIIDEISAKLARYN